MTEWVLFDADDTLFDFRLAAKKAFHSAMQSIAREPGADWYERYLHHNHLTWTEYESGLIDSKTLRGKRFELLFTDLNEPDLHEPFAFNKIFLQYLIEHSNLLEGALDLLQALHGKVKLGVITNGLEDVQMPRIRKQKVDHFFEAVIVSEEIGHAKPQAAFFDHTFQAIGHPPKERVLVVGDSLQSDIRGARGYGLRSCWYNPKGQENPGPHFPDHEIRSLDEVLRLI
jgi:2-haloacid dehalogenase